MLYCDNDYDRTLYIKNSSIVSSLPKLYRNESVEARLDDLENKKLLKPIKISELILHNTYLDLYDGQDAIQEACKFFFVVCMALKKIVCIVSEGFTKKINLTWNYADLVMLVLSCKQIQDILGAVKIEVRKNFESSQNFCNLQVFFGPCDAI